MSVSSPEEKNRSEGKCKRKKYTWSEKGRRKHIDRMRALHADPAFKAKMSDRMRALNADPAFNPLAGLTPEQRDEYDVLVKKGGYKRNEALALVLGERATIAATGVTKNASKK